MKYKNHKTPTKNNICAIVVTYFPDKELPDRIERILKQLNKVVIVDNNSSEDCLEMLKKIKKEKKVELIINNENLGVATALNIGFRFAINCGDSYDWCLTMDQDSLVNPEMVQTLIEAYADCKYSFNVGIIGSNYQEWTTGSILFNDQKQHGKWTEVQHLPTSGCLTSIPIYQKVGDFRDEFFIDYVDTEYCIRLRESGFKVIISPKVIMKHPLGYYKHSKMHNFLFGQPMVSNYPAIRCYYWTRNGIIVSREQLCKNFKWSIGQLYYLLVIRLFMVILFEDNKLKKLTNIFTGILHALILKTGKLKKGIQ